MAYAINSDVGDGCEGQDAYVLVNSTADSVLWITPFGNVDTTFVEFTLGASTSGSYYVNLWDENSCLYVDSLNIDFNPLPVLNLDEDTMICARTYIGGAFMNAGYTLYWENGWTDSILISSDGWYSVTATNAYGCSVKDSIYVDVIDCENELPNVFTPNGDGVNDFFVIDEAPLYPNNRLEIYNRWGNVVFVEDGYNNTFQGSELHDGTYFYVFYYYGRMDPVNQYSGFVTILH
jgi:gliding motility-associated-like protein